MNSLSHTLPSWWPWMASLWLILALGLGSRFVRRTHPHLSFRTRLLLWILRSATSAVVLLLILNWSHETTRQTEEKPLVHILVDRSASMAVKDAPGGSSRYARALQAVDLLSKVASHSVADSFTSDIEPGLGKSFPDGQRSAVGQALLRALENSSQQALGGVVVISDFAASDEDTIREVLQTYHAAKVPVFPWVIGTEAQPADVRLVSARLTQPSPSQPTLRVAAAIESPGYAGNEANLEVVFGNQPLASRKIQLTGGRQSLTFDFPSPYRGLQFYEIRIAPLPGEASTENNTLQAACELRRDPIRVLYMEGSAPTETSFLKNGLETDQDMEVHCLHFPAPKKGSGSVADLRGKDLRIFYDFEERPVPSVCHPNRGFPADMTRLLSYDVVILSDIIKDAFSPEQILNMVAFVEEFGGGFVMVGGDTSFGAGGWEKTPIDKLMPIEVSNRSDPIWSRNLRVQLESGPLHPILQVADTLEETQKAWDKNFPGFNGLNYVQRVKPGALVLARTEATRPNQRFLNENPNASLKNLILFAVQQIGRGRTMAFCSDTTTAWGDLFEKFWGPDFKNNHYYARFWNNTIRWLAADRIARKKGQTSLQVSSPQCAPGDSLLLSIPTASASDLSFLELSVAEAGQPAELLPVLWNNPRRCWEARFTPQRPGETRFEAAYRNPEGAQVRLEAGTFVTPISNESVAVATRPELASEIARDTGGQVLSETNAAEILEKIAQKSIATTWKGREPVWNSPWLLLTLLGLIVAEWVVRRRLEPANNG